MESSWLPDRGCDLRLDRENDRHPRRKGLIIRPPLALETWGKVTRDIHHGQPSAFARYRDSDGESRQVRRTGRTHAEAERKLIDALKQRIAPPSATSSSAKINELIELWWEEYLLLARSDGTKRRYRQVIDKDIVPGLGKVRINEATVSRLDRFIKAKTVSVGPATAKICVVVLSQMFDLAARHDIVRTNPMKSVASVRTPDREITSYSIEDVTELRQLFRRWDASTDKRGMARVTDLADPVDMYLATGCRTGELLAASWSSIDLNASPPTFEIVSTVVRGDAGLTIQPKTKSATSQRLLKLPPFAAKMLERRREDAQTDLIFPSSTGTLRAPSNFLLQWHSALAGSRFEGAVPKSFCSTVATLVERNSSADQAKKQLGHSSVSVTNAHYIKPSHAAPDLTATLETFNTFSQSVD